MVIRGAITSQDEKRLMSSICNKTQGLDDLPPPRPSSSPYLKVWIRHLRLWTFPSYYFLFVFSVVVSLLGVFSFTAISFTEVIYCPSSSLSDELSSLLLSFSKVFSLFRLPFSIKSRWTFLFLIKPLSTPDPQVHLETYSGHEAW